MNNKPVAWYKKESNDYLIENIGQLDFQVQEFIDAGYIPLYTHPVKEEAEQQSYQEADGCPTELAVLKRFWRQHNPVKELTDEEIRELGRMSRKWQDPYVWLAKRINRPLKDLTNKEIQEVITEHEWYGWTLEQFAKAILRKAQEK